MAKTILVVDDFPNTRKVITFSLNKIEDICILEADNGREAMKFFDGRKIDLLVTDLNMPVMDGIQLASEVRSMKNYLGIPILMLTTEINEKKKDMAQKAAITAWIQKPFKAEQFFDIVKKCLR